MRNTSPHFRNYLHLLVVAAFSLRLLALFPALLAVPAAQSSQLLSHGGIAVCEKSGEQTLPVSRSHSWTAVCPAFNLSADTAIVLGGGVALPPQHWRALARVRAVSAALPVLSTAQNYQARAPPAILV